MSDPTVVVREHLRHWLHRNMTGCGFAAHLASEAERIGYLVVSHVTKDALDSFETLIDESARGDRVARQRRQL